MINCQNQTKNITFRTKGRMWGCADPRSWIICFIENTSFDYTKMPGSSFIYFSFFTREGGGGVMGILNTKFVFRTRYCCNKIRRGKINEIISTSDGRFTAITPGLTGTNRRARACNEQLSWRVGRVINQIQTHLYYRINYNGTEILRSW